MPPERSPALLPVLCLIATTGQAGSFLYLPALPEIARALGTGEAGVQATLTAFLVGTCLGFGVYGQLADRFGHRVMLVAAGAVFALASLAAAAAPDLGSLTAARLVQGFGSVAGIITARATIRNALPAAPAAQAMAGLTAAVALSPAASPLIGAAVLEFTGWRSTFVIAAGLGVASIFAGLAVLPPTPARHGEARPRRVLATLFGSPVFRACLVIGAAANSTFMVMMAGSPFVFVEHFALTPLSYTTLLAVILIAFAGVALSSGRLVNRIGGPATLTRGLGPVLAGATAVAAASLLLPMAATVGAALFVMVASMGLLVPTGHTMMLEPFPGLAGTAAGVAMLVMTGSGALALALYGQLAAGSVAGFGLAVAGLGALTLVGWRLLPASAPVRP